MRKIKKIASLLLTMIMVLGIAMPTFAADPTYTLKINTVANHTYKIYQLATGDVSSDGKTLSNIEVGQNAKSGTTVDNIKALVDKSGAELGDAAYGLINPEFNPIATVVGTGEAISQTLPGGYYVIVDTYTNDENVAEGDSISRTMVSLVADETITPKTITVQPDKKITGVNKSATDPTDTNSAAIGDVIDYRLAGSIPDMTGYTSFKYVLVDTMSKGLQLTPKVEVGDELSGGLGTRDDSTGVITPDADKTVVTYIVTGLETTADGKTVLRLAVKDAISYKNDTGKWFYVDLKATLTADAEVVKVPNTNSVKIEFSNVPGTNYEGDDFTDDDPKGTTPEIEVETYTTSLTITKNDETDNILQGAEFELKSDNSQNVGYVTGQKYVLMAEAPQGYSNGTWYKLADGAYTTTKPTDDTANKYADREEYALINVDQTTYKAAQTSSKAFVDGTGKVTFTGLGVGDYTLSETTTPDGYNTIGNITFKVTWAKDKGFEVTDITGGVEINVDKDDKGLGTVLSTTIVNKKGSLLPSTGGIGTTIFYIIGGILVIGAGIILVVKKRMSQE